jgi:hypothetical protein
MTAAAERMKSLAWFVWVASRWEMGNPFADGTESRAAFDAWWESRADEIACPACRDTGCIEGRDGKDLACPLDCDSVCGSPGWGLV